MRNPDKQTRIHIAPPFCRTLTAYGVIKSPIYSSCTSTKDGPVSFTKSRTAERSFTISSVVFGRRDATRRDAAKSEGREDAWTNRTKKSRRSFQIATTPARRDN